MLPRYRRLVERLAQEGHLKVICGTDTLGVGINVPIRTVLFTPALQVRRHPLPPAVAREFHQIAGRAGRAGYDTTGTVWCRPPSTSSRTSGPWPRPATTRKKRKVVKKKPPDPGFVNWSEETFERLVAAQPERSPPASPSPLDAPQPARPAGRRLPPPAR
jgi:hypothetical protein